MMSCVGKKGCDLEKKGGVMARKRQVSWENFLRNQERRQARERRRRFEDEERDLGVVNNEEGEEETENSQGLEVVSEES